jgi:hypothetical protein
MAYTSDLRMKNIIKDIHIDIINILKEQRINVELELRVFDESTEDSKLFEQGGLTFKDPYVDLILGSNDAGWILNGKPLVIVEGTFGTERGQFGDGQLNRFSHSAAVAMNGYVGVTLIPFNGESYSKSGTKPKDIESSNIKIKYAKIHKGFLTGALSISKKEKGYFLVMDAYDRNKLIELVVESVKERIKINNKFEEVVQDILIKMKSKIGKSNYGERSKQTINTLYNNKGEIISKKSRFYTQNYAALTTSEKRDGHGMLGKNLIEIFNCDEDLTYSIFIRLDKVEIEKLKLRKSKEFKYIFEHPKIKVISFDDLVFTDKELKDKVLNLRNINIFQERQNELIKTIQHGFNIGSIRILN